CVECQARSLEVGDALNEEGPCVMPGLVVFVAWIAQTDDQLNSRHSEGPFRCFEWSWGQDLLGGAFCRLAGGSGGAGSLDVGDHQVVAVGQGQQLNTLRQ